MRRGDELVEAVVHLPLSEKAVVRHENVFQQHAAGDGGNLPAQLRGPAAGRGSARRDRERAVDLVVERLDLRQQAAALGESRVGRREALANASDLIRVLLVRLVATRVGERHRKLRDPERTFPDQGDRLVQTCGLGGRFEQLQGGGVELDRITLRPRLPVVRPPQRHVHAGREGVSETRVPVEPDLGTATEDPRSAERNLQADERRPARIRDVVVGTGGEMQGWDGEQRAPSAIEPVLSSEPAVALDADRSDSRDRAQQVLQDSDVSLKQELVTRQTESSVLSGAVPAGHHSGVTLPDRRHAELEDLAPILRKAIRGLGGRGTRNQDRKRDECGQDRGAGPSHDTTSHELRDCPSRAKGPARSRTSAICWECEKVPTCLPILQPRL